MQKIEFGKIVNDRKGWRFWRNLNTSSFPDAPDFRVTNLGEAKNSRASEIIVNNRALRPQKIQKIGHRVTAQMFAYSAGDNGKQTAKTAENITINKLAPKDTTVNVL